MQTETLSINDYLTTKGIEFKQLNGELIAKCVFNRCDEDSRSGEAHLYFNIGTGQYQCKKCGESGNLVTLAAFFGDNTKSLYIKKSATPKKSNRGGFNEALVTKCFRVMPDHIFQYLSRRGIPINTIRDFKIGYGTFYGRNWITIPVKGLYGNYEFFKLRQDPNEGDQKITYPRGVTAQVYDWQQIEKAGERIIICEGELDRLLLLSKDINAITSTHGVGTFKKEWAEKLSGFKEIFVCFDRDKPGIDGANRVAELVKHDKNDVYIINLPKEVGEGGDLTDYFVNHKGKVSDLFKRHSKEYPEKIDTSQFKPIISDDIKRILELTIKSDNENKLITFLCQLSAYTEDSQLNLSFNAPSSSGKSYIPNEIAHLFPQEDVIQIGYCSPTSFFHDTGVFDKEKGGYIVDLSRKILIFLDQPHTLLLQHLRPVLSHDKKEILLKITDKSQKSGLRTKNIFIIGFPAVIFCTAGLKLDEQEATRFLLLSPETNQDKIRAAINQLIKKEADNNAFKFWLNQAPERNLLKERIRAIKLEKIKEIQIGSPEKIKHAFFTKDRKLKPRHQRDISRIISFIKIFALVNLWFRERSGSTIVANDADIVEAFKIWDSIAESQELNLPPFIYQIFQEIVLPVWHEKAKIYSESHGGDAEADSSGQIGLTRQEIQKKHFQVHAGALPDWLLRQQILPMLENAGLITQIPDPKDKRRMLVTPTTPLTISPDPDQNNSESHGGVLDSGGLTDQIVTRKKMADLYKEVVERLNEKYVDGTLEYIKNHHTDLSKAIKKAEQKIHNLLKLESPEGKIFGQFQAELIQWEIMHEKAITLYTQASRVGQ